MEEYVETLSRKRVKMSIIEEAAYDSLETIMSVLPEEAQTYDMIICVKYGRRKTQGDSSEIIKNGCTYPEDAVDIWPYESAEKFISKMKGIIGK